MRSVGAKDGDLDLVRVRQWEQYEWLRHGFSTRAGGHSDGYAGGERGELNLGFTREDDAANVTRNRLLFVQAVAGEGGATLVTLRQVHGTRLKVVRASELQVVQASTVELTTADGRAVVEADGMMTDVHGVLLGIQVADCVPVLVADVRRRVVAGFHAGWRGTVAAIVERGIERMREEYGCAPEDLIAAVGPAIGACCYAVGGEIREEFGRRFRYAEDLFKDRADGLYLDLAEANRRQLMEAGMQGEAVTVLGECTACARVAGQRRYFSYRGEAGLTGRAMGAIGIAGEA